MQIFKNFQQKVSVSIEKVGKGDPLISSGFVCYVNKTGTSKVGAISKAQKAQIFFFKFSNIFFFEKMSHSAEKCKRGDHSGFINIYSVAKYQKTRKGDSFDTLKNFF